MHAASKLAQLDQYNFHHDISEMPGKVIVFFTSPDCGACHALRKAVETLLEQEENLSAREIDAVMNTALTNEFGFFHLPSLYLYIDGKFHAEIHSQADADSLRKAIETLSAQPAQEEP